MKADDLLDRLIASAKSEVDSRHPELTEAERTTIATQIAVGALRYFMLKFTKSSVIAFDFKDALSFEGETGPYAQYAVVRATNIFRKGGFDPDEYGVNPAMLVSPRISKNILRRNRDQNLGTLAGRIEDLYSSTSALPPPSRHTWPNTHSSWRSFSTTFYHRHPILSETDEGRKRFLLATVAVVRRELIRVLAVMGISVPP